MRTQWASVLQTTQRAPEIKSGSNARDPSLPAAHGVYAQTDSELTLARTDLR